MNFINRKQELEFLNNNWHKDTPQLIILYGKRRVGKTELTVQFAKDKPHIYFLCERIAGSLQLKKFSTALLEFFNDTHIPKSGFEDWEQAFSYLASKKKKFVLIIDEFPYLAETDKGISSTFQKAWDLHLKNSHIYLVLCGSSISMMEKTCLFYKAPLYGRRTGQFLIKPFRFSEFKKVFSKKSFDELLAIYSIVGGTITYLKYFQNKNYLNVLREEIFKKGQFLYEEVEFLLREELKEPRNYFSILDAMSLNKNKLSEIINETGFDKATIIPYLTILNSLQIVKKEISVTEKIPEKSRKSSYVIDDNFFNFWFRFVFRNRNLLEENRIEDVIKKVKQSINELMAKNYEKILPEIFSKAKIASDFQYYGRFWDNNEEIDMVAISQEKNTILFSEAKWSNKQVGINIYEDLKRKSRLVIWGKPDRKEYFALFSKSGFTPDMRKLAKKEKVYLFHKDKLVS